MAQPKIEATHITVRELHNSLEQQDSLVVIDVRTPGEFRAGHVARAINVPMDDIVSRLEDIPEEDKVVLVCQSGTRAAMTKDILGDKLDRVICLEGGMDAWEAQNFHVVRATRTKMALDRQAMIGASVIILTSVGLGHFVNPNWYYLALLPGVGLMMAGAAGVCLMGMFLSIMPWNKAGASK